MTKQTTKNKLIKAAEAVIKDEATSEPFKTELANLLCKWYKTDAFHLKELRIAELDKKRKAKQPEGLTEETERKTWKHPSLMEKGQGTGINFE